MFGVNGFYDYELDYNHKRTSLGAEIRSSILELNSNYYFALSNSRTGKDNIKEDASLRLKRSKPFNSNKNTLDKCMLVCNTSQSNNLSIE